MYFIDDRYSKIIQGKQKMKYYAKYLKDIRTDKGYDQETLASMSVCIVTTCRARRKWLGVKIVLCGAEI